MLETLVIASGIGLYVREFIQKQKKNEDIPSKMDKLFDICNIYVKNNKTIIKPTMVGYKPDEYLVYTLPIGMSEHDFLNKKNEIKTLLNTQIEIESKGRKLTIHMYDLEKYNYELPEDWEEKTKNMFIPLLVGKSYNGYEIIDLTDCPHVKIGGTTGKSKTNLIRVWAHQLLKDMKVPLEVNIIDLKYVSFKYLKDKINYAYKIPQIVELMTNLHEDMFKRMEILVEHDVDDIKDIPNNTLPYKILIIDEISQISPAFAKNKTDKQVKEEIHAMLIDILCLARALGVHVILASQRPDRDILPGQMKANLPCSIAFKCVNAVNSEIMLDNDAAAKMPDVKGRAILQFEKQIELQVANFPFKEARRSLCQDDNAGE